MESEFVVSIFIFFLLLFLSAFFSGSESAYFSLTNLILSRMREDKSPAAKRVIELMKEPRRLLITILTGNTIVNIGAATIAALFMARLSRILGLTEKMSLLILIQVITVTLIILILSEISPKLIAVKNAQRFSFKVSLPLKYIAFILSPVTFVLIKFADFLSSHLGIEKGRFFYSEEEIKALIEMGEEKGALQEEEKQMINSIFEFGETTVKEVMVPRIDMVCVEKETSIEKLVDIINEKGHTRIPVYEETMDHIKGIIHAKDLLPFLKKKKEKINLLSLARPPYFVPESKKIDELLREFQRERIHMAIVVDEYGGTAGLITLEDIIEEIVGEIQDEYDFETPLYRIIDDKTILLDAKIDLHDLNELLEAPLPTEEGYDTLGGFLYNLAGYVPKEKEVIKYNNYDFVIEKTEGQRIVEVRLRKREG